MAETIIKNLSVTYQFNSDPKPTIATKIVSKDSKTYLKLEMKFPASFFDGSWTRYFTSIQGITAYGLVLNSTIRRETAIETVIDNSNRTMYVYALLSRSDVGKNITGLVETETVNITSQRLWRYQATYDSGLYAHPFSMADSTSIPIESTWFNQSPTLTLTSPANNQTLAEGNTLPVQGSASDADSGNVVTVKYKINSGTTRALTSGVSDGSSPLSFARTLTYSNKRIWDGSTDVAGVDLAEGVDHTLTVWAEDNQGGKSAEVTRKFRVIWNRPPSISGANEDLGTIMEPPSKAYTVTEPEGNPFTITEYLDGEVLRTFSGVAGQEYTVTIPTDKWLRTSLAQHTLKVRATDSAGLYSERVYTFTRTDDRIEFELAQPFLTDAKANRVLFTLDAVIPTGATLQVEACNNAFDAVPTYEDITGPVSAGRGYVFTNETKTATQWGINIRVKILKGTATDPVIINGFGGAFD